MDGYIATIEFRNSITGMSLPLRYLYGDTLEEVVSKLCRYYFRTKGLVKADDQFQHYQNLYSNRKRELEIDEHSLVTIFRSGQRCELGDDMLSLYFPRVHDTFDEDFYARLQIFKDDLELTDEDESPN